MQSTNEVALTEHSRHQASNFKLQSTSSIRLQACDLISRPSQRYSFQAKSLQTCSCRAKIDSFSDISCSGKLKGATIACMTKNCAAVLQIRVYRALHPLTDVIRVYFLKLKCWVYLRKTQTKKSFYCKKARSNGVKLNTLCMFSPQLAI